MTPRTCRIDDRASAGSSRTSYRTVAVTLIALTILARPASAKWLGAVAENGDSKQGNTRVTQISNGAPTATHIAYNHGGAADPESYIVLQDHSVILVPTDKR